MKYCLEKYPLGSLPNQQTAGKYMDGYLYGNLEIIAKTIKNDMTHLSFIFSSTLEVGTGKSVLAQQIGEAYTEMVNKMHGLNLSFDLNNIVFKPKDLIERAFKLPKYSCVILDEWEDAHYWSELGMSLRQFFRKCRQLNLFMICIIPNFFQLPISYAISRSTFAIDVRFEGEFERGYFRFYNFPKKKELYVKGKKTYNYDSATYNFQGRFTNGYAVPDKEYREAKLKDMLEYDEKEQTKKDNPKDIKIQILGKIAESLPIKNQEELGKVFDLSERTIRRYLSVYSKEKGSYVEEEEAERP